MKSLWILRQKTWKDVNSASVSKKYIETRSLSETLALMTPIPSFSIRILDKILENLKIESLRIFFNRMWLFWFYWISLLVFLSVFFLFFFLNTKHRLLKSGSEKNGTTQHSQGQTHRRRTIYFHKAQSIDNSDFYVIWKFILTRQYSDYAIKMHSKIIKVPRDWNFFEPNIKSLGTGASNLSCLCGRGSAFYGKLWASFCQKLNLKKWSSYRFFFKFWIQFGPQVGP